MLSLYWSYISAIKNYELAKESEKRATKLLTDYKLIVEAGQQPQSTINKLEANLQDKKAITISKKYSVLKVKNSLGLAMGVNPSDFDKIPAPTSHFLKISEKEIQNTRDAIEELLKVYINFRYDYKAQLKLLESTEIKLEASIQDLSPKLNMQFSLGTKGYYSGGGELKMFKSITEDLSDLEWKTGFLFSMNLENDAAKGWTRQCKGNKLKEKLNTELLSHQIQSEIMLAVENLQSLNAEVTASKEALKGYNKAREDEYEKFRLGYSTLMDVMDTEDRLNLAEQRIIIARSQLSQAIVHFRFAIGQLIIPYKNEFLVNNETINSLKIYYKQISPIGE